MFVLLDSLFLFLVPESLRCVLCSVDVSLMFRGIDYDRSIFQAILRIFSFPANPESVS